MCIRDRYSLYLDYAEAALNRFCGLRVKPTIIKISLAPSNPIKVSERKVTKMKTQNNKDIKATMSVKDLAQMRKDILADIRKTKQFMQRANKNAKMSSPARDFLPSINGSSTTRSNCKLRLNTNVVLGTNSRTVQLNDLYKGK
eukprot:TRINITY_DN4019_c0_g1_i1.p1 TRINITY_DN4019_c0_g1~~TRINITY_DN4019_c0_g1_i1.p1  ORF type:complete len:143 (+),score=15.76 TRINITY_DN4019_c0_g1_i1:73-501(+)